MLSLEAEGGHGKGLDRTLQKRVNGFLAFGHVDGPVRCSPAVMDAIDEANGTVTVKAADGTTETVKPRNRQNLKRLKTGDELVIGLYRGIAISLAKEPGGGAS